VRVWIYALKEGFRTTIGLTFAAIGTIALTWLAIRGFTVPPHEVVVRMITLAVTAIVIGFPCLVVSVRLAVRKANRTKAN